MIITFLQRLLWMVALVAAQVMVFNYIHLFGYATPLPYVYLLMLFPLNTDRWSSLLWGFVCGLLCDIASLTLGVGMAAMTFVAFIQPPLLQLMVPKDAVEDLQPGIATMGFWPYVRYTLIMTSIFVIAYFIIQTFNFFHPLDFLIAMTSSWGLTFLMCLILEGLRYKSEK